MMVFSWVWMIVLSRQHISCNSGVDMFWDGKRSAFAMVLFGVDVYAWEVCGLKKIDQVKAKVVGKNEWIT